ncbi:MAG: hypothetical protein NTY35_10410 [Planctomycetota bacterium]|nr:hypothetical protein [Planctomycetota bacterium]
MTLTLLSLALALLAHPAEEPLKLEGAVELPGVRGRIDHMDFEPGRDRLWIAALENDTVEVVDLAAGKHERSIATTKRPTGVASAAKLGLVLVASGADGRLDAYDATTLERKASIEVGPDADNVRWDALHERALVGYGDGALAIVDVRAGKRTASVPLGGHPESFQLDVQAQLAYVNVPDLRSILCVDLRECKVVWTRGLGDLRANYPLAIDARRRELLIGCRAPSVMAVRAIDAQENDSRAMSVPLAGDVDDLFHDALLDRVYAACGAGFLDVLQRSGAHDATAKTVQPVYEPLARIPTAAGARTGLFVPETRRLFLAVPRRGEQRSEIRIYAAPAAR